MPRLPGRHGEADWDRAGSRALTEGLGPRSSCDCHPKPVAGLNSRCSLRDDDYTEQLSRTRDDRGQRLEQLQDLGCCWSALCQLWIKTSGPKDPSPKDPRASLHVPPVFCEGVSLFSLIFQELSAERSSSVVRNIPRPCLRGCTAKQQFYFYASCLPV